MTVPQMPHLPLALLRGNKPAQSLKRDSIKVRGHLSKGEQAENSKLSSKDMALKTILVTGKPVGPKGFECLLGLSPCPRPEPMQTAAHSAPLKILLTVRGLSPCSEPFPPSRLKPSPADVFSSVTVQTVASVAKETRAVSQTPSLLPQ